MVDAVRASIRPPEPSARLSAELAVRLADAAGQAMTAETPPAEWLALLEVVVECPVRRTVKPAGLPAGADEALLAEARKAAGLRARAGPTARDPDPAAARARVVPSRPGRPRRRRVLSGQRATILRDHARRDAPGFSPGVGA